LQFQVFAAGADQRFGITMSEGVPMTIHMSTLTEGQRVSYDVVTERGKTAAGNLKAA